MRSYPLGKLLTTNTDYQTEDDTFLVIQKICTDDTAKLTLKVDGIPVAEITQDIAGKYMSESRFLPAFDLGDLFIVVPPNKILRGEGTAAKAFRIIGFLNKLEPGEAMPATFAGRWAEQGLKYYSYKKTVLASDTACGAGSAIDIISFECPAGEKWVFDNMLQFVAYVGGSKDYEVTCRLVLQDQPFDNLVNSKLLLGIDQRETPYPPGSAAGFELMTLKDRPINVEPGQILKVQAVNTSSSSKTIQATTTKALIVGRKEYLKL